MRRRTRDSALELPSPIFRGYGGWLCRPARRNKRIVPEGQCLRESWRSLS